MSALRLGLGLGAGGRPPPGWSPLDLAGNILWLPASVAGLWQDSGASVPVVANENPVGYRSDLSASGLYLPQATAGQRPTWAANGFGAGKPAIAWDGVDDILARVATLPPLRTLQLAYRLRAASGPGVYQTLCHLAQSNGNVWVVHICNAGGYTNLSISNANIGSIAVGVNACNDTSPHVLTLRYTGSGTTPASWRIRIDGVDQTVLASGSHVFVAGTSAIGRYPSGPYAASLDLACILGWDTELSGIPLADSEDYLTRLMS